MKPVFDCGVDEVSSFEKLTVLVICFSWSPSSVQLYHAALEAKQDLMGSGVAFRFLDGDGPKGLEFCAKNGIVAGSGGIKCYEGGREVCVRRGQGTTGLSYTLVGCFRPSQIKELVGAVQEAKKSDAIATLQF